jgi:hypothetical protein
VARFIAKSIYTILRKRRAVRPSNPVSLLAETSDVSRGKNTGIGLGTDKSIPDSESSTFSEVKRSETKE